jgi:hypothetical protein
MEKKQVLSTAHVHWQVLLLDVGKPMYNELSIGYKDIWNWRCNLHSGAVFLYPVNPG